MNWRARISPSLIVIAACARPFVAAAAQAGYRVAAFDAFHDVETRHLAAHSARVAFSQGGFDAGNLWRELEGLAWPGATVVYGGGLENQPALIDRIARHFDLAGNDAATVARIKNPQQFFSLLDDLGVAYPETRLDRPRNQAGWLVKSTGGSGGTHIRHFEGGEGDYYQRCVQGFPVSVLFLANGAKAEIVGYNEQWLAPAPGMPCRYGGAVGNADLPDAARRAMEDAVRMVVAATGLRGLNSMDFMLCGEKPLALEINPRLSASFDLYDAPDLLQRHLRACRGELFPLPERRLGSKSHLIHYASRDLVIDHVFDWPAWVVDTPIAGTLCRKGEPLCTVLAQGCNAEEARSTVFARARQLEAQLEHATFPVGTQ